jgi:DNA repair photolyase
MEGLFNQNIETFQAVVNRIDGRYRSTWLGKPIEYQRALADYFLPRKSRKAVICPTRPRVIKWYCPFAHQNAFPSGHRYCINVYTGCSHGCEYCYAASYEPATPATKRDFHKLLAKDIADLEAYDVPPAPVHLSNSTDPFQPLEAIAGHTRLALDTILAHRKRFTSVVVLTKNPSFAASLGLAGLMAQLARLPAEHPRVSDFVGRPAFVAEVSLAFWREDARQLYDPHAPSVQDRVDGLHRLAQVGVPLAIRIDPLFPRSGGASSKCDYKGLGLVEPQTLEDIEQIILLAKRLNASHVVYSPAKIVQPRMRPLSPVMRAMRSVYDAVSAPQRPTFRGGSWRLPPTLQAELTRPLLDICRRHGVKAKCCKQNLVETT